MKDVEKTKVKRKKSRKRERRRMRKMNLYGLVVLLLVLTAGITISYTFLFNISEIRVSGESDMYSAEQIVAASGIDEGDNLLRLNTKKSEQKILDELLYVETASVDRKFPSSLEITVSRCIPAFNVNYGSGTLLVSKKGKILADNGYITDGLPIIYGLDPADTTPGRIAESSNDHKNEAFSEIIGTIVSKDDSKISTVDLSDEHAIIVNYKNGMIFKMGNWNDAEYKLNLAETVMEDENVKGKKGYLTMIGTNQCSFRTTDGPVINAGKTEQTSEQTTDPYGNSIGRGEQNPEQEASFNRPYSDYPEETTASAWNDNGYYGGDDSQWNGSGVESGYNDVSGGQW